MGMQLEGSAMTIAPDTTQGSAEWPELQQRRRAIVVVDVVESVRLMQANEADVIDRWRRFVHAVRTEVLPVHGGRLVKSLGDGLLLEFESVQAAVTSSFELQRRVAPINLDRVGDAAIRLRIGVHVSEVVQDELDIYGAGVNLAARITTLAGPSEIVVSAEVRDELVDGLDAELEDLGECFVKHLSEPVRVFRIGARDAILTAAPDEPTRAPTELRPTVAVIPFRAAADDPTAQAMGDTLTEEVIAGLSVATELNVISRLSTLPFRDRNAGLSEIASRLGAGYVVSGSIVLAGERIRVSVEVAEVATGSVLWADALRGHARDVFEPEQQLVGEVVAGVARSVVSNEVRRASAQPLATLRSYSLMLGAITLMHRSTRTDFDRARAMLEHLVERERGHARPHAWLANWHALRVTQGQPGATSEDTARALDHARRALARDPGSSLALAIDGVLQMNLLKDFAAAGRQFDAALQANPNEALAWLFKGVMHAFQGAGQAAHEAATRALALSPLDPMRHYYDSLAATAALGAGQYERAEWLALRSLRANRQHPSTYRALAIAQSMQGHREAASISVRGLLELTPSYRVRDFKQLSGFSAGPYKDLFAEALASAGLPD
jgi:class 3 adenylate cyclase/TolB-like protein